MKPCNRSNKLKQITLAAITAVSLLTVASVSLPMKTANAKAASANNLSITVSGITGIQKKGNSGNIIIAIYDSAKAFNANTTNIHSLVSLKATRSTMKITLRNFPKGRYAVSVLHDKNGNGHMDFGKNQLPSEAYAYSKNVGTMSVPTFKDAEFSHKSNTALSVKMIQPI